MVDKPKKAVALTYDPLKDRAPKVSARGKGWVAERIIAIARQHQVPLYEDANLVRVLETIDTNTEIPVELYKAIAEVLVYVYRLERSLKSKYQAD